VWGSRALALALAGGAAQAAALPIVALRFGRVSLYALLANLLAVPLGAAIVALGGLLALLGAVWCPLALPLVPVVDWLLRALIEICAMAPEGAPLTLRVGPPAPLLVATYYLLLAGPQVLAAPRARAALGSAAALAAALIASGGTIPARPGAAQPLRLHAIDVGQGDALLLRTPGGGTLLVDAGPSAPSGFDAGMSIVGPCLRRLGLRRLDGVLLTHAHMDHAGGMASIMREFSPGRFFLARGQESPRARFLGALARGAGTSVIRIPPGCTLDLGSGVIAQVLSGDPTEGRENDAASFSLVLRIIHGRSAWLLMGDAGDREQRLLAPKGASLRCDLMKIPHHGGPGVLGAELLGRTRPSVGFISVARWNPWGHPARETLGELDREGISVFRTDLDGMLTASSDGKLLRAGPVLRPGRLVVRVARGAAEGS